MIISVSAPLVVSGDFLYEMRSISTSFVALNPY